MTDLRSIITEAAQRYNLPPEMMLRIAQIESGMNPNSANPNSSARGVFQFMTKPGGSWDTYGKGQNPLDPHANADAGARYITDNMSTLRSKLGREPQPWEVYLAHQQGRGGAPALLANPNSRAIDVLAPFYKDPKIARDAIVLNGGREDQTAGEFANLWKAKYEGSAVPASAGTSPLGAVAGSGAVAGIGSLGVPNPLAAYARPEALGSILSDVLAPLAKDQKGKQKPEDFLAKHTAPKTAGNVFGELGAPVQLSS